MASEWLNPSRLLNPGVLLIPLSKQKIACNQFFIKNLQSKPSDILSILLFLSQVLMLLRSTFRGWHLSLQSWSDQLFLGPYLNSSGFSAEQKMRFALTDPSRHRNSPSTGHIPIRAVPATIRPRMRRIAIRFFRKH